MAELMLNVDNDSAYAETITDGLNVTFTLTGDGNVVGEDCVFFGSRDDLETVIWRYVTPVEMANAGAYVNDLTASDDDKQDFLHFSCWLTD